MKRIVNFEGVKARVRNSNFKIFSIAFLAISAFALNACTGASTSTTPNGGGTVDVNETAATVNGKVIKMQEVARVIKQQGGGQESKLSPLELAQARLQVLESLIQQEVMFQKAEKEKQVPTDDEVTAEYNKRKTASGISQEEFDKKMKEAGETDASIRETIKRGLAIQKLTEKITNKIEPPKDSEIDAFYVGNKEAFVKKKGVKIAAIVIDPKVVGEGDTTTNEQEAMLKAKELFAKVQQPASDFAALARENSEDQQSRLQGGDLGYLSQEELSQGFSPQLAAGLMDPRFPVGQVTGAQAQGKYFIIKLQERSDKDENLTLESPGIRQQVTDSLINARKQLLAASFQSLAMDEAKIENYLARKVVENPNELSGARPAGAATATPANTDANTAQTNANVAANVPANSNVNAKMNANVNTNANTKANTNAK